MGFILSLLYIAIAILSPAVLVPWLAPYHLQIWMGLATIFASIPSIPNFKILSVPQVRFLGLVTAGIAASFLVKGWLGGTIEALNVFIPNAIVFFFVLINFRSLSRLHYLAMLLLGISLYLVIAGGIAYVAGDPTNPMIYVQSMEDHTWFPRIRGFGFLNDPNDLAQFLLAVLPLLWINWREKRKARNFALVLLPAAILLTGIFLTHSRGAMIALAVVTLFAFKDVLGTVWSTILAGGGFVGATLLGFSGGRDVSVEAGAGRIEAWGAGIGMLISHPLFGVGYNQFYDYYEIAAHNTFIHCAAELGLFGYFFWMALVVFSMSDLGMIVKGSEIPAPKVEAEERISYIWRFLPNKRKESKADEVVVSPVRPVQPFTLNTQELPATDVAELKRWATVVRLATGQI